MNWIIFNSWIRFLKETAEDNTLNKRREYKTNSSPPPPYPPKKKKKKSINEPSLLVREGWICKLVLYRLIFL